MRIMLDTVINNDELPFIEPAMQLIRPSSLAVYDMQSLEDLTGNAVMDFSGTFNSQGAVLSSVTDFINTKINEKDNMSLIFCWNLAARSGVSFTSISNLTPNAAPYSGCRLATDAAGASSWSAGTGLASPSVTTLGLNYVGAWTVQTLTISPTAIQRISHGGTLTSAALTSRSKSNYPLHLNAIPDNIPAYIKTGTTGTIGFFCAYEEILSAGDAVASMNIIASIMATRGVTVP
ncbi:TPA: hypothetical protein MFG25_002884 [Klebsiella pneumoniae]|nr:hypothetical protein [Klebsiella pneumoniae]